MGIYRHWKWDKIMEYLDNIAGHLGNTVHDKRCGKNWDVGQAVLAELYGPNWNNNPTFEEWNQKDDSEPPEPEFFNTAKKMAEGYIPEWSKK